MICRKDLKEWDTALISKRMPERKRIVRFEIVFSCIPFLLRLSQIVEPEPEPHPRPPRIRLKINYGFRTLSPSAVSPTNPDLSVVWTAKTRQQRADGFRRFYKLSKGMRVKCDIPVPRDANTRSEEHTSELQSPQ